MQATDRFQSAAGRQIDAGVVALINSGNVRSVAAGRRVREVEQQLRGERDVVRVQSFYDTHNAAMVARDGRSSYVLAYFKPLSDKRLSDDASVIESRFASQHDVLLGGTSIANAQVNAQVSHDLGHAELLAFPLIFVLSLLFFRPSWRPCCRRCSGGWRSSAPSSSCASSRPSPTSPSTP